MLIKILALQRLQIDILKNLKILKKAQQNVNFKAVIHRIPVVLWCEEEIPCKILGWSFPRAPERQT